MIHQAECRIVIDPIQMGMLKKLNFIEPPIPTDQEIEEIFPDWQLRARIFCGRCAEEEGKDLAMLTQLDIFRYGMKFMIVEAKKII